jgi:hypothetical protein
MNTPLQKPQMFLALLGLLLPAPPAHAATTQAQIDAAILAKVTQGLASANALKAAINKTYRRQGPSDMQCSSMYDCINIGATLPPPTSIVYSVTSEATGAIHIFYQMTVLPAGANILTLTPVNARTGARLDMLTDRRTPYVWDCGTASTIVGFKHPFPYETTIPSKYLPADCKK